MKPAVLVVLLAVHAAFASFVATVTLGEPPSPMLAKVVLWTLVVTFLATVATTLDSLRTGVCSIRREGAESTVLEGRGVRPWAGVGLGAVLLAGLGAGIAGGVAVVSLIFETPQRSAKAAVGVEVGDPVPDLTARLADGSEWTLSQHAGQVVLLHFWASRDDSALGQMLRLRQLVEASEAPKPVVVGVCLDDAEQFPAELPTLLGITWPQVFVPGRGADNPLAKDLGVIGFGSTVWVVGSDGTLAAKNLMGLMLPRSFERVVRNERLLRAPAPDIATTTLDGAPWRLSDQRGKVVVLDFWATWCGPCKAETPTLLDLHRRHGDRADFQLVGISLDRDEAAPRAYCADHDLPWVQLFEPETEFDNSAARAYQVQAIPSIWVIDRDGRVAAIDVRGEDIASAVVAALGTGG